MYRLDPQRMTTLQGNVTNRQNIRIAGAHHMINQNGTIISIFGFDMCHLGKLAIRRNPYANNQHIRR